MDSRELEILYRAHGSKVYNLALSYLLNREDAEETVSDVFLEIFHAAKNFRGEAAITTWVYRITVNKCIDRLRHRSRAKRNQLLEISLDGKLFQVPDLNHPGVLLENKEKTALLFQAIGQLPDNQKHAFILQQVENCSNPQIAEVLKISVGAVESLLHRAKQNLRKEIEKYFNP